MDVQTLSLQAYELKTTGGINQRYHQLLEWWWGAADKCIRVLIGVLSVLGVLWPMFVDSDSTAPAWSGFALIALALVLNVMPLGDREKFHADLFRGWSELRKDAERLEFKLKSLQENANIKVHFERSEEIADKANSLNASEPAPWKRLLKRCYWDEIECQWGEGIRSNDAIERERAKRLNAITASGVAAAG